jgi:uncharacterized membrane protein
MTETKTRTIVRANSNRITPRLITIFWTWLFTGDFLKSAGFASALHVLLTIDYYFHERLWLRIRWGMR